MIESGSDCWSYFRFLSCISSFIAGTCQDASWKQDATVSFLIRTFFTFMNIFPSPKLRLTVSIMTKLWAGWFGVRISSGRQIFSCPNYPDRLFGGKGIGFSFLGYGGRCLRLYNYLLLMRRLRESADIPPFPLHFFMARTRTVLIFTCFVEFCIYLQQNYRVMLSNIFTRYLNQVTMFVKLCSYTH